MNRSTKPFRSAVLALATLALSGNVTLAGDLPQGEEAPADTNIVVASTITTHAAKAKPAASEDVQDAAVVEALESVSADSKLELEMRLSGLKSPILTADL